MKRIVLLLIAVALFCSGCFVPVPVYVPGDWDGGYYHGHRRGGGEKEGD